MVDAILLVRKLSSALCALKSVLLAALVLQVSVQVVIPVVGALAVRARVNPFGSAGVFDRLGLLALLLRLAIWCSYI